MSATTSFCSGNSRAIGFWFGTRRTKLSMAVICIGSPLLALQLDVFVGGGECVAGDQPESRLLDTAADAVEERELVDRREDGALVDDLLHAVQDRLALAAVELRGLLAEE